MTVPDVLEVVGFAAALLGLAAVVVGVAMLSIAAAWIVGGLLAAALGVLVAVIANRADARGAATGEDARP